MEKDPRHGSRGDLRAIKLDLLFWTREVYERVNKQTVKNLQTKGKGKAKRPPDP